MSDADLTASGSTHQPDRRLSDLSRGRQCAFMSLSAMLLKRAMSLQLFAIVIVAKSHVFCCISHNLAHFQKFIESLLDYNFKNVFALEPG